jgi:ABC-2 type transport system permease protein
VNRLIRAEALKLRSTRGFWVLILGGFAFSAVAVAAISAVNTFTPADQPARQMLANACPQPFALVLGVLAVTREFRHKTITPAVLITPRRTPLLAAKLMTLTATGLIFGLLTYATAAAIVLPVLSARHIASQAGGGHLAAIIAGGAIATALFTALGVGIGAVIRNQAGAIIATLGLFYVLAPLLGTLPGIGGAIQRFGPTTLSNSASGTTSTGINGFLSSTHVLGQVPAALVLASYALAVAVAGAMLFRQRDLTA